MSHPINQHIAKIHVNFDSANTAVELDGKMLENVESFSVSQRFGEFPILTLNLMTTVQVDGEVATIAAERETDGASSLQEDHHDA